MRRPTFPPGHTAEDSTHQHHPCPTHQTLLSSHGKPLPSLQPLFNLIKESKKISLKHLVSFISLIRWSMHQTPSPPLEVGPFTSHLLLQGRSYLMDPPTHLIGCHLSQRKTTRNRNPPLSMRLSLARHRDISFPFTGKHPTDATS